MRRKVPHMNFENKLYLYNQQLPRPYYSGQYFLDAYKQHIEMSADFDIHPISAYQALHMTEEARDVCHQVQVIKHHAGYMDMLTFSAPKAHATFNLLTKQHELSGLKSC